MDYVSVDSKKHSAVTFGAEPHAGSVHNHADRTWQSRNAAAVNNQYTGTPLTTVVCSQNTG